ncbi:MAG: hypothetical protein GXO20_05805, partial [Thermodesulfobacteria bacterium]|nr:hypothetical protein [Thermodesulfobacteriota bacterium]
MKVPEVWEEAFEKVCQERPPKVLVLGGVDAGKSTFCLFLARHLFEAGLSVALLDADVGQKDVGPPTTIGLRHLKAEDFHSQRPLPADEMYFVGSVTPVGHLLPLVVGTGLLSRKSRAEVTIVNTTGLIKGPGVALKTFQIENLSPDLIVALEREEELAPILEGFRHLKILRLRVPQEVGRKDPTERRKRREEAYRKYFSEAQSLSLPKEKVIWQRKRRLLPQLLLGVSDGKRHLGLAILEEVGEEHLRLFSPLPEEAHQILICGSLLLKIPGQEMRPFRANRSRKGSFPSRRRRSLRGRPRASGTPRRRVFQRSPARA